MTIHSADAAHAFEFRSRISLAFHQQIQRAFVVISSDYNNQNEQTNVELEQSRQHRSIMRELIMELNAVAAYFGENFEDTVLDNLVVRDELDYLTKLSDELVISLRNWHLLEAITFSSPRMLSVNFAAWLQSIVPPMAAWSTANEVKIERRVEFWSYLNQLLLRGRLQQAKQLLCQHSEIAAALSTEEGSLAERAMSSALGGITRTQVTDLLSLFDAHPFAVLLKDLSQMQTFVSDEETLLYDTCIKRMESLSPQQLAKESLLFAERVQLLRQSASPLLKRNPQFDQLLRILQGELSVLLHEAQGSWSLLSLAKLLYCYSPGLTRHNLSDILENAMVSDRSNSPEKEEEQLLYQLAKDALAGRVLSVLRVLHSVQVKLLQQTENSQSASHQHPWSPVASACLLQTLCHVSLLLEQSGLHPELGSPLPSHDDHLSFTQELALQTAQAVNALNFSPKMVVFYARHLPDQLAASYVDVLLTHRTYATDTLARDSAQILSDLGRSRAAGELLAVHVSRTVSRRFYASVSQDTLQDTASSNRTVSQAEYFAQRYQRHRQVSSVSLPHAHSHNDNDKHYHNHNTDSRGRLCRFLSESGRWHRLQRWLDVSLADVSCAFSRCLPWLLPHATHATQPPALLLPSVYLESQDLLFHRKNVLHSDTETSVSRVALDLWTLQQLVTQAEDIVDASVRHISSGHNDSVSYEAVCRGVTALQHYCRIVRNLLQFHRNNRIDTKNNVRHSHIYQDTVPLRHACDTAAELASLLFNNNQNKSSVSQGVVPHCVEVSLLLHACVATLELQQSRDTNFLRHIEMVKRSSLDNEADTVSLPEQWCRATLSVTQAQRLCLILHHYLSSVSSGTTSNTTSRTTSNTTSSAASSNEEVQRVWWQLSDMAQGCFVSASHCDSLSQLTNCSSQFNGNFNINSKYTAIFGSKKKENDETAAVSAMDTDEPSSGLALALPPSLPLAPPSSVNSSGVTGVAGVTGVMAKFADNSSSSTTSYVAVSRSATGGLASGPVSAAKKLKLDVAVSSFSAKGISNSAAKKNVSSMDTD